MKPLELTIAITGLNATDNPGPGIPVIRSLRESNRFKLRIIGLNYENLEPGIFMHDLVDKTYRLPLPSEGAQILFQRLKYIHEQEKLDLIIPNFDSELFNFIKLSKALNALHIRTFLPEPGQLEQLQKVNLANFGNAHDLSIPTTTSVFQVSDFNYLSNDFQFPLMVKGKYYDAAIAWNVPQAQQIFHTISAKWGTPVIVQTFKKGQELNVTALGDGKGNLVGMVAMCKQYVTDKGKAWSGISINDENLNAIALKVMQGSKWKGPLELEIIKTEEDEYFLLEINPRFPAWIYLATACGQNHPETLVLMTLGIDYQTFEKYDVGKLFVRYSYDLIVGINEFEKISTLGEL